MKTYLEFSVNGDITELKTKNKSFDINDYNDFKLMKNLTYNKYKFILLYNEYTLEDKSIKNIKQNITKLPFLDKIIYDKFIIFNVDDENNIKTFHESKLLNLINIKQKISEIDDYSSDDFNLSD